MSTTNYQIIMQNIGMPKFLSNGVKGYVVSIHYFMLEQFFCVSRMSPGSCLEIYGFDESSNG